MIQGVKSNDRDINMPKTWQRLCKLCDQLLQQLSTKVRKEFGKVSCIQIVSFCPVKFVLYPIVTENL